MRTKSTGFTWPAIFGNFQLSWRKLTKSDLLYFSATVDENCLFRFCPPRAGFFMQQENTQFWFKVAAAAFSLWAAAVGGAIGFVSDTGQEILLTVREIHSDLRQLEERQANHEKLQWHQGIQSHVIDSEKMMDVTRSRLERLERDHASAMERLR
jgi:hypothetical protein